MYLLMLAIALVVGFVAAYVGAYAKKRGESFATKADFDQLLAQLKTTTAVAEEVKATVSHADWASRELKTLRRIKLEELLQSAHELQAWQDLEKDRIIFKSTKEPGPSPLPKVERISGLYFPELNEAVHNFSQVHRQMMIEVLGAGQNILGAAENLAAQQTAVQQLMDVWPPLYQQQLVALAVLEAQAREIMEGLIGA